MYQYPLELHPGPTGVWFSCPGIPAVHAVGDTEIEAFAEAQNGLELALSLYVKQRHKIPAASAPTNPGVSAAPACFDCGQDHALERHVGRRR